MNKDGICIGCTQVLNKSGGGFTDEDESRLKAFTQQVAIALENAQLFEEVAKERTYSDSMLASMSNAVVTINEEGKIATCNKAGLKIFRVSVLRDCWQNRGRFFHSGAWMDAGEV